MNLVAKPGGYRHPSLVHALKRGHRLVRHHGHVHLHDRRNRIIAKHDRASAGDPDKAPMLPRRVRRHPQRVAGTPNDGWVAYALWQNANQNPINLLRTTWQVPEPPSTADSGQTVFLFNGLQNNSVILQPVLAWGASEVGGGAYWSIASWLAQGPYKKLYQMPEKPLRVEPGQVLEGVLSLLDNNTFAYQCEFTGFPSTQLHIENFGELIGCVETLEVYGIKQCSDYPSDRSVAMAQIEVQVGGEQAALDWSALTPHADCGLGVGIRDNSSPGGQVDIYF